MYLLFDNFFCLIHQFHLVLLIRLILIRLKSLLSFVLYDAYQLDGLVFVPSAQRKECVARGCAIVFAHVNLLLYLNSETVAVVWCSACDNIFAAACTYQQQQLLETELLWVLFTVRHTLIAPRSLDVLLYLQLSYCFTATFLKRYAEGEQFVRRLATGAAE